MENGEILSVLLAMYNTDTHRLALHLSTSTQKHTIIMTTLRSLTTALLYATAVSAHGHVTGVVANGKYYMGYSPNFQYMKPTPQVPAWSAGGYGQGGIVPEQFNKVALRNPMPSTRGIVTKGPYSRRLYATTTPNREEHTQT